MRSHVSTQEQVCVVSNPFAGPHMIGSLGKAIPVAKSYAIPCCIGRLVLGGTRRRNTVGEDHSGQVLA